MPTSDPPTDVLIELILQMDERQQRLFTCACAERMIPLWERKRQDGKRLRATLQVARDYANGKATAEELGQARTNIGDMPAAFEYSRLSWMGQIPLIVKMTTSRERGDVYWPDEGWHS